jgi:hypothetical protein
VRIQSPNRLTYLALHSARFKPNKRDLLFRKLHPGAAELLWRRHGLLPSGSLVSMKVQTYESTKPVHIYGLPDSLSLHTYDPRPKDDLGLSDRITTISKIFLRDVM